LQSDCMQLQLPPLQAPPFHLSDLYNARLTPCYNFTQSPQQLYTLAQDTEKRTATQGYRHRIKWRTQSCPLCLIKHSAIKTYGRRRGIEPHILNFSNKCSSIFTDRSL
jgi:hypothetical protein